MAGRTFAGGTDAVNNQRIGRAFVDRSSAEGADSPFVSFFGATGCRLFPFLARVWHLDESNLARGLDSSVSADTAGRALTRISRAAWAGKIIPAEIASSLKSSCSGRDLNPHAFRHTPLKRTCLPFHHPSRCALSARNLPPNRQTRK